MLNLNRSVEKKSVISTFIEKHDTMWMSLPKDGMDRGPIGDILNLSNLIGEFADTTEMREMKKQALTRLIEGNLYCTDDEVYPAKPFSYSGHTIVILKCEENFEADAYHPDYDFFWEHGDFMVEFRTPFAGTPCYVSWSNVGACAEVLMSLMEEGSKCRFCDRLFEPTGSQVCDRCLLTEMDGPCIHCHEIAGINAGALGDVYMHRACKRRRLN